MKLPKRKLGIAATGLVLAGALVYLFWPAPVDVDVAPAVRGPLLVTVDREGKTRVRERYVVSAPLAGRLRRIDLHPGDTVKEGETVLAVIEPVDPALLDGRRPKRAPPRRCAASPRPTSLRHGPS
jgi:HlyD family secretion protein